MVILKNFYKRKNVTTLFLMLFFCVNFLSVWGQQVTITYNNPGAYSVTIPSPVLNVKAEAWGGGGGGGGARSNLNCQANGGGGGGGAYVLKNYTEGAVLSLIVGAGGARGENNDKGSPGQQTTINATGFSTVTAGGGGNGINHNCSGVETKGDGAGGIGGTASGGDINQNGGNGYSYNANPASSGGLSPNGGSITAQPANGNNAIAGNFPGGGGSGARANSFIAQKEPGAHGANGRVIVTFDFIQPAISGADTYCEGNVLSLSVDNPSPSATYTWKRDGISVGNGTTLNTTAQAGKYTVETNIASNTYSGASVNVSNLPEGIYLNGTTLSGTLTSREHTVTVNPKPNIINKVIEINSGETFTIPLDGGNIIPRVTTYTWSAPSVYGIAGIESRMAETEITGTLINETDAPIDVIYTVIPKTNDCEGEAFTITLKVGIIENPLPLQLLYFKGKCENGNIILNWRTASEINNNYFTVMASENGYNFSPLLKVDAAGNSNTSIDYHKTLANPYKSNKLYLRLKQTDYDGTETISNIIVLNSCDKNSEIEVKVYPNPTQNDLTIESTSNIYCIELKDATGKIIRQTTIKNNHKTTVDIHDFQQGVYILKVITSDGEMIKKIVKN